MALLNGIFNTTVLPTEIKQDSFASSILRLFPTGGAPMFALTSQSGRGIAKQSLHGYFSKTWGICATTSTAGDTDAATTLTIGSNVGMRVGMVLTNLRTKENYLVSEVPAGTTTVVVRRAFGRVTAAALNAADKLFEIGTAHVEGSMRPSARRIQMTHISNYTQIFRDAWAVTGTARASANQGGYDNVAEDRMDCARFHSDGIEAAIIWGQAKMDTSTESQPRHATQGVLDAIEQYAPGNSNAAGATTTYNQLVALLEPCYAYAADASMGKSKIAFCDSTALKVFNEIGMKIGQLNLVQSETVFGMSFSKMRFYRGEVILVEHMGMNARGLTGQAVVMDMPALKLAYMNGRDTKKEEYRSVEAPLGEDADGGSLLTELAVELTNPFSCGLITGLTAGAAN